jgi:hypothetical protein
MGVPTAPTPCATCQAWTRAASELWDQVFAEAARLESFVPRLPPPADASAATLLQACRPDRERMTAWIDRLGAGCDQLIQFTPQEWAQIQTWRTQTLADAENRLGVLRQAVATAAGILVSGAAVDAATAWGSGMHEAQVGFDRFLGDMEAENLALWQSYAAMLRGDVVFDVHLRPS